MDRQDEREIIAKVNQGERAAFAALVDAYQGPIFNLACRMTGSYEDADDLAQETFIRAYRQLRHFDPAKPFFTWLYTIGLNLIRNHLKKRARSAARKAHDLTPSAETRNECEQEENLIRSQEVRRLMEAMQLLPVDLREAVVLRFFQDLSFGEIATITGASESAVKMRVYRGLEKLRESIIGMDAGSSPE